VHHKTMARTSLEAIVRAGAASALDAIEAALQTVETGDPTNEAAATAPLTGLLEQKARTAAAVISAAATATPAADAIEAKAASARVVNHATADESAAHEMTEDAARTATVAIAAAPATAVRAPTMRVSAPATSKTRGRHAVTRSAGNRQLAKLDTFLFFCSFVKI
jgi:hypothetical protein